MGIGSSAYRAKLHRLIFALAAVYNIAFGLWAYGESRHAVGVHRAGGLVAAAIALIGSAVIASYAGVTVRPAASNAIANLVFDGGTLNYTGANVSTDRGFTINPGKTANIGVATAATNLTLTGSSSATGGLTKSGPGTLTIDSTATMAYTGSTTVNATGSSAR